ncbi:hypothetical protein ABL78_8343 [Leptomonas seymouri]|uniref:Uncharacterized protein n=1 Tax=Leptomonas seymouri TaxID=5684 RepID=A0A0N1HSU0_LEPSE|nr:hypothetical protein ABL78_8343 [Leptomonas seymouri]|eukprot:KPI82645.1 hypothetical protein ABL78_8343 [Leptomonas seymouri]
MAITIRRRRACHPAGLQLKPRTAHLSNPHAKQCTAGATALASAGHGAAHARAGRAAVFGILMDFIVSRTSQCFACSSAVQRAQAFSAQIRGGA